MKKIFLLLMTALLLAIFFCSCAAKKIEGQVFDNFNQPLEGVIVTIVNSTFQAITDSKGYYRIDYVPGSINLSYTKQGYTSENINLDIMRKESYPVQKIVLNKIPTSSEVKDLIIKQVGFPQYRTMSINKEYLQSEKVMWGYAQIREWEGAYLTDQELIESLNFYHNNKLVVIGKKSFEGTNRWSGVRKPWTVYTVTPIEKGKKYLVRENSKEYLFKSCDLNFGEITRIQMQGSETATANYTIIVTPTPFGRDISQGSENRTVKLHLFDEGWKIVK
jgi:hypothetical protein